MLPYQAVAMDYAVSSSFQRHQPSLGLGVNLNPAFTHSWFVPADLCVSYKQTPLLEPGILELRKEKSRDAARSRRGKENYEFYELAKMLPLPAAITSQLDKASIIRLTISYLKLRDFSGHGEPPWSRDGPPTNKSLKAGRSRTQGGLAMEIFEQHQGTHILQSLDGFALAVASDGRFLYISETVSIYLGLSQVEMTGSSIFDYIHHQDHSEIAEQLGLGLSQNQNLASPESGSEESTSTAGTNNPDVSTQMTLGSNPPYKGLDRAFCVRMKSTLTKRGCHFKSSGYRVVLILSRLRPQYTFSHTRKSQPPLLGMVALAIALPPPSVHEIRLESDMFVTRINFDFKIAHCEPRVLDLLDYTPEELTGRNLYSLCHGEDASKLRKCHVDLINKGQVLTHYYRIMNKTGGYTWIQTCATVVCNSKNAEEQNIICVNYVISRREYESVVMDCCQLDDQNHVVKREEASNNDPENGSPDAERGDDLNGGGLTNPPQDSSQDLEDATCEGNATENDTPTTQEPGDLRSHRLDLVTQLQATPIVNVNKDHRKSFPARRTSKRKNTSSDENEEEEATPAHRSSAISPASSCHSTNGTHPLTSDVSGETSPKKLDDTVSSVTSVKDLENAMSKHLPACKSPINQPTDFSTDALLKQQQKTTIQWIGAHHQQLQQQGPLPASALLRQLYANRESVIRANVQGSSRSGSSPGYYPNDNQVGVGALPTSPTSEGSSSYSDHQFLLSQHQNYPTSYYMDYHSMTPPSSVSPRDKQQLHGGVAFDSTVPYQDVLRHQYPDSPLPLKPQVYSYVDQPQFYHHGSTGTGFHLYHSSKNTPSTPSNWYPPS
ncbi:protein trachealess [Diabrotica undecimpunctata]|uniref:protein trachealess n=1 Tax=Diabrotica undecimpunctata TaxID=50387 RepID=UPI003B63E325